MSFSSSLPAAVLFGLAALCAVPVLFAETPKYSRAQAKALFKRPATVPFPKDNTYTRGREELGKALFFDPRLSGSNAISCASCHNPAFAWGDGLPKGVGHGSKELARRTPTVLNTAFAELLFWDGRAASLEEQALGPIASEGEMNQPLDSLAAKVRAIAGYHGMFEKAYPGEEIGNTTIAKAIATFERTIISSQAPFDKWIQGDEKAISAAAKRGFDLFNTKANCVKCHSGWNFTDDGFHDIGVAGDDPGRGKFLPMIDAVQYAFKTPTIRNADQRAPFMHDGSKLTVEECVEFYDRGGDARRLSHSAEVYPLGLTQQEKDDLCTFMRTLKSDDKLVAIPVLPR